MEPRLRQLVSIVVAQMAAQPSEVIDLIWQTTVLRGAYTEPLAPQWLEVIKELSGGKAHKFASHVDASVCYNSGRRSTY